MTPSIQFGAVRAIILKDWPDEEPILDDKRPKEAAFNAFVQNYLSDLAKANAHDPDYRVSAFTLRPSIFITNNMPRVLVLDGPDRDAFIRDVHNETERVLAMANQQANQSITGRVRFDVLAQDTTTPAPGFFDWNQATRGFSDMLRTLKDIAHTTVIRKYLPKIEETLIVDGQTGQADTIQGDLANGED